MFGGGAELALPSLAFNAEYYLVNASEARKLQGNATDTYTTNHWPITGITMMMMIVSGIPFVTG